MYLSKAEIEDLDPEVLAIWMTSDEEPAEVKPCKRVVERETIRQVELAELVDYLLNHPALAKRDAYILRKIFLENYTQKDVALALGITPQRLYDLKRRAERRLRKRRVLPFTLIDDLFA